MDIVEVDVARNGDVTSSQGLPLACKLDSDFDPWYFDPWSSSSVLVPSQWLVLPGVGDLQAHRPTIIIDIKFQVLYNSRHHHCHKPMVFKVIIPNIHGCSMLIFIQVNNFGVGLSLSVLANCPCLMVVHELHRVATTQNGNNIITKCICQLHMSNHWISAVGKIASL